MKRDLIAARDRRILARFAAGSSIRQLANEFGLTENGIVVVLQRHEAAREAQIQSDAICCRMRSLDDPDVPWPIPEVLVALGLKGITGTGLRFLFERKGIESTSLRGLFDCVVSDMPHPRPGYACCPVLNGQCVGVVSFRAIIESITSRDFGPRTNALWDTKLQILRRSSRVVGDPGRWSKPLDFAIPIRGGSDSTVR